MRIKLLLIVSLIGYVALAQQLEFQYANQQLNVYNSLTTDIPIFTQNFDDQVSGAIPIVPFTIGGQAYNTLFVSTNGFITLGQAASSTNYNPISQPQGMPVIAPFAGNLESANNTARISYTILNGFGNVPYGIIIQWKNVRRLGMQGESFSFQAKLNFTTWILPTIDFVYGDFNSVNNTQTPMEVGIRIGTGNASTEFQNIQVNNGGVWVPQQFGTTTNSTCLFPSANGAAGVPPSGMTHQWFLLYNNNQPAVNTSPICNQDGNVVIYSNYDGGTLNINCDQNIPNLKIGICTYEPVIVNINGPFVGNITEVLYAGFNSNQNNNNCGLGNFTTSISGVNPALVQILTAPPLEYTPTHQNGQAFTSSLMVGVCGQCDTIYYAGGGRLPVSGQDGGKIWNKNNQVMYDMQGTEGGGWSAAQSSVVVPSPGEPNVYYLFMMEELEFDGDGVVPSEPNGRGLRYFKIDMSLNGGLGDVVEADVQVYDYSYEGICAIRHSNGTDYWILINQDTSGIGVYSVTQNGVQLAGVYPYPVFYSGFGIIKSSPNPVGIGAPCCNKVMTSAGLYDFNLSTGTHP